MPFCQLSLSAPQYLCVKAKTSIKNISHHITEKYAMKSVELKDYRQRAELLYQFTKLLIQIASSAPLLPLPPLLAYLYHFLSEMILPEC
ncbi:hypothetical protein BCD64_08300 [Nostoc sp. MBR 210]|nr:hypothetical protein BCD64_08300 [Nostoc sp. MBR 210]